MTNEELKKKIKEILRKRMTELLGSCHTDEIQLTEEGAEAILFYADEFADALIAAGVVDKSDYASMKRTAVKYKAEVSKAENRAKAAEHRAEVAERALENACVVILSSRNGDQPRRLRAYYKAYLEAAEKELEAEGKDD